MGGMINRNVNSNLWYEFLGEWREFDKFLELLIEISRKYVVIIWDILDM